MVLNGARMLAQSNSFKSVFLSADEPLDIRRRHSLERLRSRAVRDGKHRPISVSVDGVSQLMDRRFSLYSMWISAPMY